MDACDPADPADGADQVPSGGQDGAARLTEELRLLIEMVVEHALPWLEELLASGHGAAHTGTDPRTGEDPQEGDEPQGGERQRSGNCEWCPLCAVVGMAWGQRPEFAVRLFEQAAQVVALLRAVLADRWTTGEEVHMPGFRPNPPSAPTTSAQPRADERVQHIPVRRRDQPGSGTG